MNLGSTRVKRWAYKELGICLALVMLTASPYVKWGYSQKLKEKNVVLNISYQAKLTFKWKGKMTLYFRIKRLRLGHTKTLLETNIGGNTPLRTEINLKESPKRMVFALSLTRLPKPLIVPSSAAPRVDSSL